jgi:4-diphosphocytidyl-2-C-methyl-D-erythritol kinase
MKVLAPAKINLFLSVGQRREDGLHEVSSVMQAVSLYDTLVFAPSEERTLDVSPPGWAPEDESNLVSKAVRAMGASGAAGARITLRKEIPAGAGLGGGSADAAATLVGLNELWRCGKSRKALEKLGAAIGADVPFCVRGGTAAATGAGQVLSPLVVREAVWWVIGLPEASLSTAKVYEAFDRECAPSLQDPFEVADALARGDLDRLAVALRNDLEPAASSLLPEASSARARLLSAGALAAVMSGSGPAWCGLARDEAHAGEIAGRASAGFARTFVVRSLERGPQLVEP